MDKPLSKLFDDEQYDIVKLQTDSLDPLSVLYHERETVYTVAYRSNMKCNDLEKAKYWLSQFEFANFSFGTTPITQLSNELVIRSGKKIIASFDPQREPSQDEIVIVYGNYPEWHYGLPFSTKLFRHAYLFSSLEHDVVEYNSSWESVDQIYILNMETRYDRYLECLVELTRVHAPLHRVIHYKIPNTNNESPYINLTKNHVNMMKQFQSSGKNTCMILEDDFTFINDTQHIWKTLSTFFERKYVFNVCMLSISRIGPKCAYDDLVSISDHADKTTTSGYILSKSTIDMVLNTCNIGLEMFICNPDKSYLFCIDCYWACLDKMYYFKKKLGFQRPSYSNSTMNISCHLD